MRASVAHRPASAHLLADEDVVGEGLHAALEKLGLAGVAFLLLDDLSLDALEVVAPLLELVAQRAVVAARGLWGTQGKKEEISKAEENECLPSIISCWLWYSSVTGHCAHPCEV